MKILISGGSGMLGQAILRDPLFREDRFIILSRRYGEYQFSERIAYQYWNPYVLDGWQDNLPDVDAVINLAGENIGNGFWTKKKKEKIMVSRISAGKALENVLLSKTIKPKVFLQASAVGYYGSRGDEALTEASQIGEGFLAQVCEKWEGSTRQIETQGIRRVILRTGVILSEKAGILPRLSLPIKLFLGGNLGTGMQYVPWLHIDDFPSIIHFLIHHDEASGAVNLCSQPVPFSELGRQLAQVYKRPYWLPIPAKAIQLLLGEMSSLVLDSQRVLPEKLSAMGYAYRYAELAAALKKFA